ncbi:hypothetical protein ACFV9D_30160 [Streptomyces sp. NPDC059875]|uniref:hypothetical protein n=1 Tax=unclassified Streptomyces TaxID=2593676 RepID=UPI00365FAA28
MAREGLRDASASAPVIGDDEQRGNPATRMNAALRRSPTGAGLSISVTDRPDEGVRMLPHDYPYIRDVVKINQRLLAFCNRPGDSPVFLLGRRVEHEPGVDLRITTGRPLIIVADVYDGTNGKIDARGLDGVGGGARGADGVYPWPDSELDASGEDLPVGPGGSGQPGGDGVPGANGGSVTVMCRRSVNAHVTVAGGNGTGGGPGGNGTQGVNGHVVLDRVVFVEDVPGAIPPVGHEETIPGRTILGTPGGHGGSGGNGGNGGNGGTITFISIVDETWPLLEAGGGWGPPGGPGGIPGPDGNLSEATASEGPPGTDGAPGADGQITHTNVPEADYVAGLRPLLDSTGPSYANHWAPFRIVTGNYYYHRYNPNVPDRVEFARRAAVEFERALELQPDNTEALRLQRQLVGFPPSAGEVWVAGGNNALGLPYDLDVLPSFDEYIRSFTTFSALVLDFLKLGVDRIMESKSIGDLAEVVELERQEAAAARDNNGDDVEIARAEKKLAGDEAEFAKLQLDHTTNEIRKTLREMELAAIDPGVTFGDVFGPIAAVGVAVLSVAAAIPTAGASVVALAPAMVALANTVVDNMEPIGKAFFAGGEADIKAVEDAYEKVDKRASAVVGAGKAIVNFIDLVQKLNSARTTENALPLALIQRGVERAHQLMIARNRVMLPQQRVEAMEARLARAEGVVREADHLRDGLIMSHEAVKRAGLLAITAAEAKAGALMEFAFRAKRSAEIYTLGREERHLFLDTGLISPDDARDYFEDDKDEGELVEALTTSWEQILGATDIQRDYTTFFARPHDQDTLRLSFKAADPQSAELRTHHRCAFRIDASKLPAGHFEAKVKGVRLALVGAAHPDGEISCEVSHGGAYEQRRHGASIVTQLLKPRVSTRPAKTTPLNPDEGLGGDEPLTAPRSLAFWGRGMGGEWQVTVPPGQFESGLDLSGLTQIQVWISYQFVR